MSAYEQPVWAAFGPRDGRSGTITLTAPAGGADRAALIAAVATVLARYTGDLPRIAVYDDDWQVWDVPVDETLSRAEYAETVLANANQVADPGTPWPAVAVGPEPSEFPITIDVHNGHDALTLRYRDDAVDPTAAAWFLHCVETALTADAAEPVGTIDLVAGPHPAPALPGDGEPVRLDGDHTLHELVGAQVRKRPDAVAVTGDRYSLSYRELDDTANAIAAKLIALGARRGSRVGLALGRSPVLIAAILAVLKTGAAYVPLVPGNPVARLREIAEDADVTLLAGDTDELGELGLPTLVLDETALRDRAEPVAPTGAADDEAYLIYTSGSTGRPKGVVVPHRNVSALLDSARRYGFGFGGDDVWALFHTYSWDFSVWEIFGCLATGGRLVIVSETTARDASALRDLLADEAVTVLNQTPSVFTQLAEVDARRPNRLPVRLLMFSGEPLDMALMSRWLRRYPSERCQVVNMYGITETTVACTWQPVTSESAAVASRSVGYAIPGWQVDVVDEHDRRVPPGVPGEILLGGAGIVDGYHRRPELTAAKFLLARDGIPGNRWYRTGDRGRVLPNGELEYLGRADDQVKIRGHRVELGEIRERLLADPAITAAAVVAGTRGTGAGSEVLHAYVVGKGVDVDALGAAVREHLPEYMVPATITELTELPVTQNGKLDAARLPAPVAPAELRLRHTDDERPSELEHRMGALWAETLGVPVSLDDDLFLVGGNSLLAFSIVSRVREAGIGEVSVVDLYKTRTVRRFSALLG
ncbi:non-ribosomal peptide synthetase [Amycolatopsis sp. CA-230715]|uniref:non-ribosomal peptide synthetase n=1 Tax=Amycolatopsis sp. CA-230715 TaxID=2745196 RepID=UPI001C01709F|nr:non-ribosomal peptide synthetase [Amycolatopsis sp. CA-230715]QWF85109.1 Plipastatin synthase subunit B [Amycolatopsis sp. CA-230715]